MGKYWVPEDIKDCLVPVEQIAALSSDKKIRQRNVFLYYYIRTLNNAKRACELAKVSRRTYHHWVKTDPEFKEAVDTAVMYQEDNVNAIFLNDIRKGRKTAVWRWLKHNHPDYMPSHRLNAKKYRANVTIEDVIQFLGYVRSKGTPMIKCKKCGHHDFTFERPLG